MFFGFILIGGFGLMGFGVCDVLQLLRVWLCFLFWDLYFGVFGFSGLWWVLELCKMDFW